MDNCFRRLIEGSSARLAELEAAEHKLINLTGYDIDDLIKKFAAGYTLEPPKTNKCKMCGLKKEIWK